MGEDRIRQKIQAIFICTLFIFVAILTEAKTISPINNELKQIKDIQYQLYVPGEFIVKFSNEIEVPTPKINELNVKYKVKSYEKIFKNSEDTDLYNTYIFNVKKTSNILSIIKDYSSLSDVVFAEPNYVFKLETEPRNLPKSLPKSVSEQSINFYTNDPHFSKQWALENTGQLKGTPDCDTDALEAWGIETGDPDIVISIIDTGIDLNHSDLKNNSWINKEEIPNNQFDDDGNGFVDDVRGWDFVNNDNYPIDDFGHGTACSGVAAAVTNNSNGISGVSWNCKIMPVKSLNFLGGATSLRIARGIKYAADNGADIISMSFGGRTKSFLVEYVIDFAYDKNIVLVAAAGNSDTSAKYYPAAFDNVIAVAGTDNQDNRLIMGNIFNSAASNYGSWVDIAAPGGEIYTTMPSYFVFLNLRGIKRNYDYLSGTSMSAPHVSGLAALILSKNPDLSNEEVKSIICTNVDAYHSTYYLGTGRINVFKALNKNIPLPNIPKKPLGPIIGIRGVEYPYMTNTTDPKGDKLYYMWDWGEEIGNWIGPFESGETITINHTWKKQGNYNIKVKAKNLAGAESLWSKPLSVTIPRDKAMYNSIILNLLERFPLLKQMILFFYQ